MTDDRATDFASYGAQLFKGALNPCIDVLETALSTLPQEEPGLRLRGIDGLALSLSIDGCVGAVAASVLGATARPVRAHLDDVPATNAPLLIAPGSHKYGRVAVDDVDRVIEVCGSASCVAEAGDVWLYATPILHASEAASLPRSRRVLQVDYAAEELPFGLEWLGV